MKPFSRKSAKRMVIGFIVFVVLWIGIYFAMTGRTFNDISPWFMFMIFIILFGYTLFVYVWRDYLIRRWKESGRKLPEDVN